MESQTPTGRGDTKGFVTQNDCALAFAGTHNQRKSAAGIRNTENAQLGCQTTNVGQVRRWDMFVLLESEKRADRIMMFRDIIELRYG